MRPIDADVLIVDFEETLQWLTNLINSTNDEDVRVLATREKGMLMAVMRGVQNAPTIGTDSAKHGRWLKSEWGWPDRSVHCSECGFTRKDGSGKKWKRCPICETIMDLEE